MSTKDFGNTCIYVPAGFDLKPVRKMSESTSIPQRKGPLG